MSLTFLPGVCNQAGVLKQALLAAVSSETRYSPFNQSATFHLKATVVLWNFYECFMAKCHTTPDVLLLNSDYMTQNDVPFSNIPNIDD